MATYRLRRKSCGLVKARNERNKTCGLRSPPWLKSAQTEWPKTNPNQDSMQIGRLRDALLPENEKHPYILPYKHHVTDLVIRHSHAATLHGGTALTLNFVRKNFWIVNGRNAVRFNIHKYIICFRQKPQLAIKQMGSLPAARVRPARAFSSVGVHYAGAVSVSPLKGR